MVRDWSAIGHDAFGHFSIEVEVGSMSERGQGVNSEVKRFSVRRPCIVVENGTPESYQIWIVRTVAGKTLGFSPGVKFCFLTS